MYIKICHQREQPFVGSFKLTPAEKPAEQNRNFDYGRKRWEDRKTLQ